MRKSPLKKRAKKHTNAWYRKEAVKIAKLIAKHYANYTCVTCGKTAAQGYQMHGSHIFPESKFLRLSCEPANIMCQCARCHIDWHENPLKSKEWFTEKFSEREAELIEMQAYFAKEIVKPDYERITAKLKEEYRLCIT